MRLAASAPLHTLLRIGSAAMRLRTAARRRSSSISRRSLGILRIRSSIALRRAIVGSISRATSTEPRTRASPCCVLPHRPACGGSWRCVSIQQSSLSRLCVCRPARLSLSDGFRSSVCHHELLAEQSVCVRCHYGAPGGGAAASVRFQIFVPCRSSTCVTYSSGSTPLSPTPGVSTAPLDATKKGTSAASARCRSMCTMSGELVRMPGASMSVCGLYRRSAETHR